MRSIWLISVLSCITGRVLTSQPFQSSAPERSPEAVVHTHYVAADEVEWDYAASDLDHGPPVICVCLGSAS